MLPSMDAVEASEELLLQYGNGDRIGGKHHKERQESAALSVILVSEHNPRQGGQCRRHLVLVQSNQRLYCLDRRFYQYLSHKQSRVDHGLEVKI